MRQTEARVADTFEKVLDMMYMIGIILNFNVLTHAIFSIIIINFV